jgi:uncharacterized protein (DUF488 family)
MPTVYTIGYKGKSLETFINQLRDACIDAIIDVRLRNTSHLAGYTNRSLSRSWPSVMSLKSATTFCPVTVPDCEVQNRWKGLS